MNVVFSYVCHTLQFNYTRDAGGISLETSYPYQGADSACDPSQVKPVATIDGTSAWSLLSNPSYLLLQLSDCNDSQSTMVLHTVLVVNMFFSPRAHTLGC